MTVLTAFTTFVEKNYIMFAVQKDEAGVVSQFYWFKLAHHVFLTFNDVQTLKLQKHLINTFCNRMGPWEGLKNSYRQNLCGFGDVKAVWNPVKVGKLLGNPLRAH